MKQINGTHFKEKLQKGAAGEGRRQWQIESLRKHYGTAKTVKRERRRLEAKKAREKKTCVKEEWAEKDNCKEENKKKDLPTVQEQNKTKTVRQSDKGTCPEIG